MLEKGEKRRAPNLDVGTGVDPYRSRRTLEKLRGNRRCGYRYNRGGKRMVKRGSEGQNPSKRSLRWIFLTKGVPSFANKPIKKESREGVSRAVAKRSS